MTYAEFLESKTQHGCDTGFAPRWMPSFLFDFQAYLVDWAIRRGRAAIFADCGLGKTPMQLVWAQNVVQQTNRPVLILTPLAVAQQTKREADKFHIECVDHTNAVPRVVVTNYEKLHHFSAGDFSGVVCDECFVAGTNVETDTGLCYIENVRPGDVILNAIGADRVIATSKRKVDELVKVTISGISQVSSRNHPYFTERGWIAADSLRPGDAVMETESAMRLVRGDYQAEDSPGSQQALLQSLLLGEMENAPTKDPCCCSFSGSSEEAWRKEESLVSGWKCRRRKGKGSDQEPEPDVGSRGPEKAVRDSCCHAASPNHAGWKRPRPYGTANLAPGSTQRELGRRTSSVPQTAAKRLSQSLQARPSGTRKNDRNRSRWSNPSQPKASRREERRRVAFARVEGVEILEQGHPDLERFRDADGCIYCYDIEAARHPSFSVNGVLVHNSSILKCFDGKRKAQITEFMRCVPYRLLCTATAAPNDYIELGTSSEALGELGYMDMLGRYFKNDQNSSGGVERRNGFNRWMPARVMDRQRWRFKGHAEQPFWRWVCSWARACRKPSDLGFSDDRFVLPLLREREHVVESRTLADGMLFSLPASNMGEEREERRRTVQERCEMVADLANHRRPAVVWCHLNKEGDLLSRMIPDAEQIAGSTPDEEKVDLYEAFATGNLRVVVIKPKIGAWGLNWQHCQHVITFASHSYEQYYQSVRRCWRFGQKLPVTVDLVVTEGEQGISANLRRKSEAADRMFVALTENMNNALHIGRGSSGEQRVEIPAWA